MAVRTRLKISAYVSSTSSEERDLGKMEMEQYSDASADGGSWKTTVAGNASNVQLRLGNLTGVTMLVIRTRSKDPTLPPAEIRIKKNSTGGEEWSITPFQDQAGLGKEGFWGATTNGVTALYASNQGATDMEVIVTAAGS